MSPVFFKFDIIVYYQSNIYAAKLMETTTEIKTESKLNDLNSKNFAPKKNQL